MEIIYQMAAVAAMYGGEKAQFFHTARIGALIFMVFFGAVAAAEFFRMDIPGTFAVESGMAVRKRLRQLNRGAASDCGKSEAFVIEKDIVIVHTDERIEG